MSNRFYKAVTTKQDNGKIKIVFQKYKTTQPTERGFWIANKSRIVIDRNYSDWYSKKNLKKAFSDDKIGALDKLIEQEKRKIELLEQKRAISEEIILKSEKMRLKLEKSNG